MPRLSLLVQSTVENNAGDGSGSAMSAFWKRDLRTRVYLPRSFPTGNGRVGSLMFPRGRPLRQYKYIHRGLTVLPANGAWHQLCASDQLADLTAHDRGVLHQHLSVRRPVD